MADERKMRARRAGSSRGKSVNEKHFSANAHKTSARRERKPLIATADGKLASVTYRRIRDNGDDMILHAGALNRTPALAAALAAAFTACFRSNRPAKVVSQYWGFLGEFAESVAQAEPAIVFEAIERRHLSGFMDWLDKRNANGTAVRNKNTRALAVLIVQRILRRTGHCGHVDFIKRPYASVGRRNLRAAKRTPSRRVPRPDEARKLLLAALREIQETMSLHEAMGDPGHPLHEDPSAIRTLAIARDLAAEFGTRLPFVGTATGIAGRHGGSWEDARRAASIIVPTLHAIAPFCIILMIALRLDGQMSGDLLRKNVGVVQQLGLDRLQAKVWRSKVKEWKTLTAALSAHWHSPDKLVAFMDRWSHDLREATAGKAGELQFIIAPFGSEDAKGLGGSAGVGRAIKDFCIRNGLPPITSSIPRKLAIELGDMLSAGDAAARARIGGHTEQVNLDHYDTAEAAARGDDAYGVGLMLLTSHRLDHGATPDKRTYMPEEDVMAATPGWWCSRPFDPPAGSGQSGRRPCAAYGWCPACPNGEPRFDDPVSCKRVGLLLEAILRSEPNMPPDVWEGTWKPIADELAFKYIPIFEAMPEVTARAAELDIGPMMEVVSAQNV